MLIKPAEVIVSEALDEIGKTLKEKGVSLEDLPERSREIRAKWSKRNTELPAAAKKSKVDFLVTLDKKHLSGRPELADYVRTKIVVPETAAEYIRGTN